MHFFPLISIVFELARGGGGGSGGGGGGGGGGGFAGAGATGGGGGGWGSLVYLIIIVGVVLYLSWRGRVAWRKKLAQTKADLATAALTDPDWDEAHLEAYVRQTFSDYQSDWSSFNLTHMATYSSPEFQRRNEMLLAALHLLERRNEVADPVLISAQITDMTDAPGTDKDQFSVTITARATDRLIDETAGRVLFTDPSTFTEYWTFVRSGSAWLLDTIVESTQNVLLMRDDIVDFAAANNMIYSLDMGWLLIPSHGQLFGDVKFGTSDVNNHVIGEYHDILVQLYTYAPRPAGNRPKTYVIAQVELPKHYGSIVIESKTTRRLFTPRGYNKMTLEWPDFNKRYRVFATDVEQVTTFELLHPVYMEKLFALPFTVNIEVVDNVVYLYTTDAKADYTTMFGLLQSAFSELKL